MITSEQVRLISCEAIWLTVYSISSSSRLFGLSLPPEHIGPHAEIRSNSNTMKPGSEDFDPWSSQDERPRALIIKQLSLLCHLVWLLPSSVLLIWNNLSLPRFRVVINTLKPDWILLNDCVLTNSPPQIPLTHKSRHSTQGPYVVFRFLSRSAFRSINSQRGDEIVEDVRVSRLCSLPHLVLPCQNSSQVRQHNAVKTHFSCVTFENSSSSVLCHLQCSVFF